MSASLPQQIDVRRFAEAGRQLQGEIQLQDCPRLTQAVACGAGPFSIQLEFDKRPDGQATVTGAVSGQVKMNCQRCLELVTLALDSEVSLGVVADETEAEFLPDDLDPLIVEGDIDLVELVEDELLLALPLVPLHDDCEAPVSTGQSESQQNVRDNPFAVLASLKKDS